ncbi:hypothetical protein CEXT_436721, partial [Caerostris extrusa]
LCLLRPSFHLRPTDGASITFDSETGESFNGSENSVHYSSRRLFPNRKKYLKSESNGKGVKTDSDASVTQLDTDNCTLS